MKESSTACQLSLTNDISSFPLTRFMGSKRKLLGFISEVVKDLEIQSVLDAFSGSGCVSYLFKTLGKTVTANDFLAWSYNITNALVANNDTVLSNEDLEFLIHSSGMTDDLIQRTFNGLYFTPEENAFLDRVCGNIGFLDNQFKKSLAVSCLCHAALKKQPRGVFTIVGHRYDDGRKDLRLSMEKHFCRAVGIFNAAVFDNGHHSRAMNQDIFSLEKRDFDLVYFDPPYYSPLSDNDYIRRYHFVEGLATYWEGVTIKANSKTKRIEKRDTPFAARSRVYSAFERLFAMFPNSHLLVSYSSNCIPTKKEMIFMMKKHRKRVEIFEYEHKYSFGNHNHKVGSNRNSVKEYLFLGY